MINQDSIESAVKPFSGAPHHFVQPNFEKYSFHKIPETIAALLRGRWSNEALPRETLGGVSEKFSRVVLLLVDAFGWSSFTRLQDKIPFLQRMRKDGTVSKLSSMFPSTTTAHMTTLYTGVPPWESGIYEWYYYEPKIGRIICPLRYAYGDDEDNLPIDPAEFLPESIFPFPVFYQQLSKLGVVSSVHQPGKYSPSYFSDAVCRGALVKPYSTESQGLSSLFENLHSRPLSYDLFYFGEYDAVCHKYGPESKEATETAIAFFNQVENSLATLAASNEKTLVILTADHDQCSTEPSKTVYLDRVLPDFQKYVSTGKNGAHLVPAGSARDLFIHIKDEQLDEAGSILNHSLQGIAKVYPTSELVQAGVFAPSVPSSSFYERMANLVVLPYENQMVYWDGGGKFTMSFRGHHGGLSRREMESLFAVLPL